jgi:5-methylcytosine-specific restriction endonuclease McrA
MSEVLARAQCLSDRDLLTRLKTLAHQERETTVALIAHLAVLDERRLHLSEGYSSLFSYCTEALGLSEHATYGRIEAARAARRFPILLEMLADGSLTLTTVGLLAPHLTPANHHDLLMAARRMSKRRVEELVAQLHPLPSIPPTIRKLPLPSLRAFSATLPAAIDPDHGSEPHAEVDPSAGERMEAITQTARNVLAFPAVPSSLISPSHPAVVEPLGERRYRIQFTARTEFHDRLRLAQDLLRHQIPDGDLAEIMDRALTLLVETLAKERFAATGRPRERRAEQNGGSGSSTRHIPAQVKRAVWLRDGGRCAYVAHNGRRCDARGFLEFHHVMPYAEGGEATVANIELRCRAHNHYEATLRFGETDLMVVSPPDVRPRAPSAAATATACPARAGPG